MALHRLRTTLKALDKVLEEITSGLLIEKKRLEKETKERHELERSINDIKNTQTKHTAGIISLIGKGLSIRVYDCTSQKMDVLRTMSNTNRHTSIHFKELTNTISEINYSTYLDKVDCFMINLSNSTNRLTETLTSIDKHANEKRVMYIEENSCIDQGVFETIRCLDTVYAKLHNQDIIILIMNQQIKILQSLKETIITLINQSNQENKRRLNESFVENKRQKTSES